MVVVEAVCFHLLIKATSHDEQKSEEKLYPNSSAVLVSPR